MSPAPAHGRIVARGLHLQQGVGAQAIEVLRDLHLTIEDRKSVV